MILQGQTLAALATCHEIEDDGGKDVTEVQLSTVSDLRRSLEHELLETDIEFATGDMRLRPVSKRNLFIGRPAKGQTADIAIDCRWLSRADKSLKLSSDGDEWFVEDLGSANGSFIGEKRLQRNDRHPLPSGRTTVEIGRSFDRRSPVILEFNRATSDVIVVSVSVGAAFDKTGRQSWPTLQDDLATRWLVFRDEFALGSDYANKILGLPAQQAKALITFSNGFWVKPSTGSEIHIDGVPFRSAVPIPSGSDLAVGTLRLRAVRAQEGVAQTFPNAEQIRSSGGIQQ